MKKDITVLERKRNTKEIAKISSWVNLSFPNSNNDPITDSTDGNESILLP